MGKLNPRSTLLIALLTAATTRAESTPAPVDFVREVAPVLTERCLACHHDGKAKGGLDLSSASRAFSGGESGPAIVAGKPDASLLLDAIVSAEPGKRPAMPKTGDPLAPDEVARLRRWIAEGASWPRGLVLTEKARADLSFWSLQPLHTSAPPEIASAWTRNPIDRFILARLQASGLSPSPEADRRTLIRRATFDLTGLPPSPEDVASFEADDRPDAYEQLVDRLLASPQYGERWGRHWLDVARFGESTGYERNIILDNAWPYRDYVIRTFNTDAPFDRFIIEQLAGDVVGRGDPTVEVATAFLVAGPYDNVGNQDAAQAAQIRANTLDDIVTASGTAFLGLTLHCARCHDHKFDPIPTDDYYRLQSTFAGVTHGDRELASAAERAARTARLTPLIEQAERLKKEIAALKAGGNLADFKAQLAQVEAEIRAVPPLPRVWAGQFQQPGPPSYRMIGGDPAKKGPTVAPASLAVLGRVTRGYTLAENAPESDRRLALARWLVADENPLTPRVLANRVWLYHFGTGIVDTPSDFGYLGGRPTHPELLDWLALRLKQFGWRLKPLHREIMLTQTYRQSSAFRAEADEVDASTRFLWRFPPRRLSAEEVRDTMLSISGRLDLKMGGPGFRLYEYRNDNVSTYVPLDVNGPETFRRAVYHQGARAARVDLLSDFDCPDNASPAPTRAATTTPLQALTLLNHGFTREMSRSLADRLPREAGPDPSAQVARAFFLAFSRLPSSDETQASLALIHRFGLPSFCRALLNTNELISLD